MPQTLKTNSLIFLLYLTLTILVTYPAIYGLIDPYTVPSTFEDAYYFLWHLWWMKEAMLNLAIAPTFTHDIFHPSGGVLLLASPFNELAAVALQPWLGLTRTFSFLTLFSLPTTAFTSYLLTFYFSHNRPASFIGGLIFSFSAYHYDRIDHAHLGLFTLQFLPLYVLALFLLWHTPTYARMLLTTIAFVLAIMSEHVYYLFYFTLPLTTFFFLWTIYHVQRVTTTTSLTVSFKQAQGRWLKLILALSIGGILVAPIYFHLISNRNQDFLHEGGVIRNSAEVGAYLTPSQQYKSIDHDIFIGFTAMILSLITLFAPISPPFKKNTPFTVKNLATSPTIIRFWLLLGIIAFIFSLGPLLQNHGLIKIMVDPINQIETYILLPYIVLLKIPFVSALRAPARLSVVVQLTMALLATIGLSRLTKQWSLGRLQMSYLFLALFILIESRWQFSYHPPITNLSPPILYQQIANEQNNLALLEIPSRRYRNRKFPMPTDEVGRQEMYTYMYYATIHQHPLVGGHASRTPLVANSFLDTTLFIRELMHPFVLTLGHEDIMATHPEPLLQYGAALLAQYHIGYVVLHRDLMEEFIGEPGQALPEQFLRQTLGDPFYDEGDLVAFRVPQTELPTTWPTEVSALANGWYPKLRWHDQWTRWLGPSGTILIASPQPTPQRLQLTAFPAMLNPISVTLKLNDQAIETFQIPATATANQPYIHTSPPLNLTNRLNEIKLELQPIGIPDEPISPVVTVGVTQIKLEN